MRALIPFNDDWLYLPDRAGSDVPDSAFARVTLPHCNKVFPHHNFDSAEYEFVSTYRKHFALLEPLNGRRVYLDFDGAMIAATVSVNGHAFPEHPGGYTPFSFDITEHVRARAGNLLVVHLDSSERPDIPPYGNVVDYLTFGGIYRDVWLRLVEPCHVANVFVRPVEVLSAAPRVEVDVWLRNQSEHPARRDLSCAVESEGGTLAEARRSVDVPARETVKVTLALPEAHYRLWTLDDPRLYQCVTRLYETGAGNNALDAVTVRFGLRQAEFRADGGFYLNGERLKLVGLNRHQTYPYIGPAAPPRLQRQDADLIKHELGCTIVRTSHYPQSPHFLDRCDEIGLLVFEEIPGWQHIGDEDWQALSLRDVRAMIERDRNHPAIIIWGVRINESPDDERFFARTNALARALDPTRPTGGVRNFLESQFLEDVFTYNDFSNTVVEPVRTPHLITEFNGHMFPTKLWDHEERQVEHALRHARIHDRQLGMGNVAGAIGWCAFDYNTHHQFGSGDRICYHGVMDIFRLPKFAAYAYASQLDPARRVVLFAASFWALGDHDAGRIERLVVFSNCDSIEVFAGDQRIGRFAPDRAAFPHLPHPPYQVPLAVNNLTWGQQFPDLRVIGYLGERAVAEHRLDARTLPDRLVLQADFAELCADGADMTRVVFKIVDRYGNRLPYTNQPVFLALDGPADLIGENPFAVMGGQAAVYVRARHEPGLVTVRAVTPRLAPQAVTITIR